MARAATVRFKASDEYKPILLNSEPVMSLVNQLAYEIQGRASSMYGAERYIMKPAVKGRWRCHAIVATGDMHAVRSNALHMTLKKAIGSG